MSHGDGCLLTAYRSGMANLPDILKRIADCGGWVPSDFESRMESGSVTTKAQHGTSQDEYNRIWQNSIGALIEPATAVIEAMCDGLEHAGLQLEIIPRPGTKRFSNWMPGVKRSEKTDREAEGEIIKPGHPEFSRLLEEKLTEFSKGRVEALTAWANNKGLSAEQMKILHAQSEADADYDATDGFLQRDRQQLYLLLYVQHMVSRSILQDMKNP